MIHYSRLIPINKASGGVIPIVLVVLLDKIAGSVFVSKESTNNKINEIIKPLQIGIATSSAIEMVNKLLEIKIRGS
jgi:hypothetical protein